ncbi:hypothetical protein O6H91_14G042300 [Diphasiastrum complanatum]|uniref:Uncharacterized protein n=1 Tax=Diphasiastrum complanatum TaxID=34168 RepID=A0ACC2BPF2_DIPCM|nr:hypothetical protein O6H91_14G042300 [Diphasiastrum complanatum]
MSARPSNREREGERESEREMAFAGWPSMFQSPSFKVCAAQILLFGFLIRCMTSLHSYSGASNPPKYGDYEAQRHWMEITINVPVQDWYKNTTDNDLEYWGLDYPPLSAYQSFVHGLMMRYFEPASVALKASRGYETPSSKLLMRWTVLSSDAFVFFPAAILFVISYYGQRSSEERASALATLLLQPALILIDHGHFQFNCISLGLSVAAAAAVISGQELLTCVLFSLSVNHKQMSMYYAPAFFAHLFGRCLHKKKPVFAILKLGLLVFTTFVMCWWPFLSSKEAALQVLSRVVPLHRGIYEDYVANFWCVTAILIKWKQQFPIKTLARFALGTTILAILPSMVQQILAPSRKVHEKSILVPLLPATLLALDEPWIFQWLTPYALLSMFPLLRRDKLAVAYMALFFIFLLLNPPVFNDQEKAKATCSSWRQQLWLNKSRGFSLASMTMIQLSYLFIPSPASLPFLFDSLISIFAFAHFVPVMLYTNYKQWLVVADNVISTERHKEKKQ